MKRLGFTLIELIIVVIILGLIAVVSLPKFIDFKEDAHLAKIKQVGAGMAAGLRLAHDKWRVSGKPDSIDFTNSGYQDIHFSATGWVDGATNGSSDVSTSTTLLGSGADGNQICLDILKNLVPNIDVIKNVGTCPDSVLCAWFNTGGSDRCEYSYNGVSPYVSLLYMREAGTSWSTVHAEGDLILYRNGIIIYKF